MIHFLCIKNQKNKIFMGRMIPMSEFGFPKSLGYQLRISPAIISSPLPNARL